MAKKLAFDRLLFSSIVFLLLLGLVMVYSASVGAPAGPEGVLLGQAPILKQGVAAALGVLGMLLAMQVDYRWLKRRFVVYPGFLLVLALLVLVLFAPEHNRTHRWLFVGGLSIQPSELAKVALVVFLAYHLDRKPDRVNQAVFLVPTLLASLTFFLLIAVQPDLSTAVIVMTVAALVLFVGGLAWQLAGAAALLALPVFWIKVLTVPYWKARLTGFLDPATDPLGDGWQHAQSLIAIGSGGLTGVGLAQSVQKLRFLPFANSDFIYAVLCEELGLLGGVGVLLLFGVLGWRGFEAGRRAPDDFGRYLAWGITALILLQAFVHVSVTMRLLPVTGSPLPLFSYGGSSLVTTLVACGVLLNVSQHG